MSTPMTAERWRRVEQIFDLAADLSLADQQALLDRECGEDAELRFEVDRLLTHDRSRGERIAEVISEVSQIPPVGEINYTGRHIGPYHVVREIGRGGMGVVFEAVRDDDQYRKRVALKVAARAAYSTEFLQRFRHERQILAQLEHPNIARLLDGGTTEDDIPYFAMEYVEGAPIHTYACTQNLPVAARLRLFLQVCGAVEYAHQNLVIHRDLKPGNILVAEGSVRLLDFGIAKLTGAADEGGTHTGFAPVTPGYCSPEQLGGRPVTTRTDVYSLGLVLFELLTGERGQHADTSSPVALHRSICETAIPLASATARARGENALARQLRGDLDTIIGKAAHKDPARRYASVSALAEDLRRHLDGEPILARQDSGWYRGSKLVRRHWMPLTASLLLLASLVAGIVSTRYQAQRAERRFDQVRRIANALMIDVHAAIRDLPGSTKAQEVVVRTAIEYLDNLAKESGNDRSLQLEIARGYLEVARLAYSLSRPSLSRPEEARRSYEKASAILDPLRQAYPSDAPVATASTILRTMMGEFFFETGHPTESLREHQAAIQIAGPAAARHPTDTALLDALVEAQNSLISTFTASPAARAQIDSYLRNAENAAKHRPVTPDSLSQLGVAYSQAGKLAADDGNEQEALRYFRRNIDLHEQAVRIQPDNATARRNLMMALFTVGDMAMGPLSLSSYTGSGGPLHDLDPETRRTALDSFRKMVEHAQWRYDRDPQNTTVKFDYAISLGRMAPAFPPGDLEAVAVLQQSIALLRQLETTHSGRTLRYQIEFHGSLAERLRQAGQSARALAEWKNVEALVNRMIAADPTDYYPRRQAIPIFHNWALHLASTKDPGNAVAVANRAERFAREIAAMEDRYARGPGWPPRYLGWKAALYDSLGDKQAAAIARQESARLWHALAARKNLLPDLLEEARKATGN